MGGPHAQGATFDVPIPPERIIELAASSGFDSELRVAAAARKAGMRVSESVYYIDKDEGKGRELDLLAHMVSLEYDKEPTVACAIHLCIEVKKTREPFIFFTSERGIVERGEGFAMMHWLHNVDGNLISAEDIDGRRPGARVPRLARSYVGAKGSGAQQIQSGVLSAVKAALHFSGRCREHWDEESRNIDIFVPILVVDGPIAECHLDKDTGELRAGEVDEVVYRQNYLSESYGDVGQQVQVYTLRRFEEIAPAYREWATSIMKILARRRRRKPKRNLHKDIISPEHRL